MINWLINKFGGLSTSSPSSNTVITQTGNTQIQQSQLSQSQTAIMNSTAKRLNQMMGGISGINYPSGISGMHAETFNKKIKVNDICYLKEDYKYHTTTSIYVWNKDPSIIFKDTKFIVESITYDGKVVFFGNINIDENLVFTEKEYASKEFNDKVDKLLTGE